MQKVNVAHERISFLCQVNKLTMEHSAGHALNKEARKLAMRLSKEQAFLKEKTKSIQGLKAMNTIIKNVFNTIISFLDLFPDLGTKPGFRCVVISKTCTLFYFSVYMYQFYSGACKLIQIPFGSPSVSMGFSKMQICTSLRLVSMGAE